jgi:GDP-4-dehydro-6-deoxy-D-mannose reductase
VRLLETNGVLRALITGINGFVGGHLAEHLLASGRWDVTGLTRQETLRFSALQRQISLVRADLMDHEQTQRAVAEAQPDVIFHLAGQPFVPESFRDPAQTLAQNTLPALHLIQAVLHERPTTRLVIIGTNEEYGQTTADQLPINETTPLRPTNPYGVSKAAQCLLTCQYHYSHRLDCVYLRPFTHIGPRQNERFVTASFARQLARIEAGLQPATVEVGNLAAQRDLTDVRDIVAGYELAARFADSGEVYNIGSGRPVSIQDVLDQLIAGCRAAVEVRINPTLFRPIDVPLVACDATRLRRRTGWQPQYPLERTLNDILDYWREVTAADQQPSAGR